MSRSLRIAVYPGDGIGPEVTAQAVRVLQSLAQISEVKFDLTELPWGINYWKQHGSVVPHPTGDPTPLR